jgi:hypothetical protein
MNQETTDQGWQQLQGRITQLVDRFLKEDYPSIEYKPGSVRLLTMQSGYSHDNTEDVA